MTKILATLSLFSLAYLTGYCQNSDTLFINKVLSDFSRNSYFISIKVSSSNKMSRYVVKNDDLFFYFHQTNGLNKDEYKKRAFALLLGGNGLKLTIDKLKKYRFVKVSANGGLEKYKKMGKEAFLKRYFNRNTLKKDVTSLEKVNIISILYDWKIASRIDDETGYLVIED